MYRIYVITNLNNGKYYVGQTKQTLKRRWGGHRNRAFNQKADTYLCSALRKHGADAFAMDEIGTVQTHEEANHLLRSFG